MPIIGVNRDNAKILFDYWNKIGKDVPYFYHTTYKSFTKSLFDDTYEGLTIFRENYVFVAKEQGRVKGFIQYGVPTFHFTEAGKVIEDVHIGVIRNLYYEETRNDIGSALIDLSFAFFQENNIKDIYAFYHAMGMSCNGNYGKLHQRFNYIGELLCDKGFEVEHENLYYTCDMDQRQLESPNDSYIEVYDLYDNRQKMELYDKNNHILGDAEIKYIDHLTERLLIYVLKLTN